MSGHIIRSDRVNRVFVEHWEVWFLRFSCLFLEQFILEFDMQRFSSVKLLNGTGSGRPKGMFT